MKNNTKKKIMDTATLLFASQGFKGTTMRELTQAVDLSRVAIGYYFGNKELLYQNILREHFIPALEILQAVDLKSEQTSYGRIMLYAKIIAGIKRQYPFFLPLWQNEIIHPSVYGESTVKPYTSQLYQSILAALYDGITSGEFTADIEPYNITSLLVEMLHSHSLIPLVTDNTSLVHKPCEKYIRFFLRGIMKRYPENAVISEDGHF